jgi:(p)ppGpp synthase/HD superfamily hydrolase
MHFEGAVHMTSLKARASEFMRQAHATHKRKHGAPYAEHPEAVLKILTNEYEGTVSENVQAIALLHGTLEMGSEEADIAREFGLEILEGVKLLTRQKVETFGDYATRLRTAPREIRLVKAADRLHNLRETTLASDPKWAIEYAQETREQILPLVDDPWFLAKLTEATSRIEQSGSSGI